MLILSRGVDVSKIIMIISIFKDQWLLHLMWHLVLPILRCRFQSSWTCWIDLNQRLLLSLSIIANMVQVLQRIIMMLQVIVIHLILPVKRVLQLVRPVSVILPVNWWRLQSGRRFWGNPGRRFLNHSLRIGLGEQNGEDSRLCCFIMPEHYCYYYNLQPNCNRFIIFK